MAMQAQFGSLLLQPDAAEESMEALKDYDALLSAMAVPRGNDGYACWQYNCTTQSELTCNGGRAAMFMPSCKRGTEDELW